MPSRISLRNLCPARDHQLHLFSYFLPGRSITAASFSSLFIASCYGAYSLIFLLICRLGLFRRLLEAPAFYVLHRLLVTLTYNISSLHTPNISSRYPDITINHGQFAFKRPCLAASQSAG